MTIVFSKSRKTGILRIELVAEQTDETKTLFEISSRVRQVDKDEARQFKTMWK